MITSTIQTGTLCNIGWCADKPLETVNQTSAACNTPLKQGVNENLLLTASRETSLKRGVDKNLLLLEVQSDAGLEAARKRLLAVRGDPFLLAEWRRILFFHFLISPETLRAHVPPAFELDLFEGLGCISLAAVTMRHFQPCRFDALALPFRCIREQRFLNFRTYVRWNGEPGALFLHGWLSRPAPLPLPSNLIGLPYTFASLRYDHQYEAGTISGQVRDGGLQFAYRCAMPPDGTWKPADPGSVAEFAMERYSGFFHRRKRDYVFRAWHPLWLQQAVGATIEQDDLITSKFPWWKEARFAGATFAPGFDRVLLGKAHVLPQTSNATRKHRVLSSFFEMP